jgi:hypothetical protein
VVQILAQPVDERLIGGLELAEQGLPRAVEQGSCLGVVDLSGVLQALDLGPGIRPQGRVVSD